MKAVNIASMAYTINRLRKRYKRSDRSKMKELKSHAKSRA
jgi:hypothetical protein